MPFSEKTIGFLTENRMHDSRDWFNAHREDYIKYVSEPMKEFTAKLSPMISEADSLAGNVRISRIFRDARFAKDSVFRENMWCTFGRERELYLAMPCFYFDISPSGCEYGCGFYQAGRESMDALRRLVTENSPLYTAAESAYSSQELFELYGDEYKRNRFPTESAEKLKWLNRKNIGLTAYCRDRDIIFGEGLAEKICGDLQKIMPVYFLFIAAAESGRNE